MQQDNPAGVFDEVIAALQDKLPALQVEINNLDTSKNIQSGSTLTVNKVWKDFKKLMREKEGYIAEVLGGRDTAAFKEFYPHGKTEYARVTKEKMPVLSQRVYKAASTNAISLGATVSGLLTAVKANWAAARDTQLGKMGTVSDKRMQRTDARKAAELAILSAIFQIAKTFPGNAKKGNAYTNFNLLYRHTHHAHKNYSGTIPANNFAIVVNRAFTDLVKIKAKNTDDNAPMRVLLLHDASAIPAEGGKLIKPAQSRNIKPSRIGSLDNTFLIIVNQSDTNALNWAVEIVG